MRNTESDTIVAVASQTRTCARRNLPSREFVGGFQGREGRRNERVVLSVFDPTAVCVGGETGSRYRFFLVVRQPEL